MVTRSADELQVHYTTKAILIRIWHEHLRPRFGLLVLASVAMLLTAATTGAIPFLIQRTADDVFVAKNAQMVYWITAAIVIVTIVKAVSEYIADVTVAYLGHRFVADLRLQMFAQALARRSQLDPKGAFRAPALGLSQRRNADPRHGLAARSSRSARATSRSSSWSARCSTWTRASRF